MGSAPSALERLLNTEGRLDAMLAQEARDAEAILRAAQEEVVELEHRLEAELVSAAHEVDQRLAAERDARLAFIEDEARRSLEVLESVTPEQVGALAVWVVDRVLESIDGASA
ncbi:MAG TPA: hypothetical protein VGA78_03595 [Gemmatimonadales bacterium]